MLFDTHVHTCFSNDSNMPIDAALKRAAELGLGIIITEHMDMAHPKPDVAFDVNQYFKEYAKYRNEKVLLGIELGMRAECLQANCDIVTNQHFDYVIGSIHFVDNIEIYQEEYFQARTKQETYNRYFESMLDCLKSYDFIDSLGHIDYISRYARYSNPELYYYEFSDRIDEILKLAARKEKALEINTRRLGNPDTAANLLPIYKRFKELGGQMVTIGSDAHKPESIGNHLSIAHAMADACNLKVVYFKQRKPEWGK
ncbi:histidinol phosphate phosphatase [Sporomusa acidovorans]|uniref:Histidinol-phosphatase n=1 Tax=Sporomusa acidovorans (strain ATCC 49682 / DSM 3132 / Mol) TaxID=1123286 RepID=A0ABZ3J878_SPOA4|nr:histidinol phosphate phosphatase [Sporomusa acidovorans]OZC21222.1 histidinol-phosphatase [Sporomusa acidovorans DSM 3132]SDE65214.1 histidinol-phosphatase (PHP family) [Sporomusa acidovorans]